MTDDLWKILLDKGLMALLIVFAGGVLSRVLERFKATQAWETELARERLALFKRLVSESHSVMATHARFRSFQNSTAREELASAVRARTEALLRLSVAVNEAAVLFSEETAARYEAIITFAQQCLDRPDSMERESFELNRRIAEASGPLRSLVGRVISKRALPPTRGAA